MWVCPRMCVQVPCEYAKERSSKLLGYKAPALTACKFTLMDFLTESLHLDMIIVGEGKKRAKLLCVNVCGGRG